MRRRPARKGRARTRNLEVIDIAGKVASATVSRAVFRTCCRGPVGLNGPSIVVVLNEAALKLGVTDGGGGLDRIFAGLLLPASPGRAPLTQQCTRTDQRSRRTNRPQRPPPFGRLTLMWAGRNVSI